MPDSPHPDDALLLIRCPSCGQRFKVEEDLRGRTVECGGCEHRFKIQDEVVVRGRKFYPGERRDARISRFARVPVSVPERASAEGMIYQNAPDPSVVEPASPQRIVAGLVGGIGMAFMALLLILGASRGGLLDGMVTGNRVIMAGFVGLLGAVLIVYANPKARKKAIGYCLLAIAALVAIPFFFTTGSDPIGLKPGRDFSAFDAKPKPTPTEEDSARRLREEIGTQPLDLEIADLAGRGSNQRAVGVWVKDLREQNRLLIRDYLQRITGVSQPPHFYPRGGGNFLLVISGTTLTLEEVARTCDQRFGTVVKIHENLSVVEVRVDNSIFLSAPMEKLSNADNPGFYDMNLKELQSIDLERVSAAVKRLAQAEPKILRADITAKLIDLLGMQWVTFKPEICRALTVWAQQPGPAGQCALEEVKRLQAKDAEISRDIVALVVKERIPGIIPIIHQLWIKAPTHWEQLYGEAGAAAEDALIAGFPATEGGLRQSAVRLLGRVGGAKSIPILQGAVGTGDSEMKVLIEKAIASIRGRAN